MVACQVVSSTQELAGLVREWFPAVERCLVKVNWSSYSPGAYTDSAVLDWVLPALPGQVVVIEGHSYGRCRGTPPGSGPADRDWFRQQELEFLRDTGLSEALNRHGAMYVNVSEEIWAGRTVDPARIRSLVQASFGPLAWEVFYGYMPEVLFAERGSTLLLDLARIKTSRDGREWSLVLKNLFGLIPDILRHDYHPQMPRAICDIARLYLSAFPVLGVAEGLGSLVVYSAQGRHSAGWSRYDLESGDGLVVVGSNLLELELDVAARLGLELGGRTLVRTARELLTPRR